MMTVFSLLTRNIMYFDVLLATPLYCIQKQSMALYYTVLFQQHSAILKEQYCPILHCTAVSHVNPLILLIKIYMKISVIWITAMQPNFDIII